MKLFYVAGRFSSPTREGVEENIRAAEAVGIELARLGCMPVIPHCNTSHPDFGSAQDYPFCFGRLDDEVEAGRDA